MNNLGWQQQYESIKDQEDQLMHFSLRLQQHPLDEAQALQLTQLLDITRSLVYACKTLKDIHQNLAHLQASGNTAASALFTLQQQFHRDFYNRSASLMLEKHATDYWLEEMQALHTDNDQHYQAMNSRVYAAADYPPRDSQHLLMDEDAQLSTQLNVIREIHHANNSLLHSLQLWLGLGFGPGSLPGNTGKAAS